MRNVHNARDYETDLNRQIRLLRAILARVLKSCSSSGVASAMEPLLQNVSEHGKPNSQVLSEAFIRSVEAMHPEDISQVVRAFNLYFSLIHIAEETVSLSHRRRQAARGGHFWPGSFHDALLTLKQEGIGAAEMQTLLNQLLYLPVLTAHPTEVQRKSILDAERDIARWEAQASEEDRQNTALLVIGDTINQGDLIVVIESDAAAAWKSATIRSNVAWSKPTMSISLREATSVPTTHFPTRRMRPCNISRALPVAPAWRRGRRPARPARGSRWP